MTDLNSPANVFLTLAVPLASERFKKSNKIKYYHKALFQPTLEEMNVGQPQSQLKKTFGGKSIRWAWVWERKYIADDDKSLLRGK